MDKVSTLIGDKDSKYFKVLQSMYDDIKYCIYVNGQNSDFFYSNIGLRQGENLSPVLFVQEVRGGCILKKAFL